jgi:glycosyltransferase involved in cell wall biosynthesis
MRIGATYMKSSAANYRAIYPLQAMERRGHDVVPPDPATGGLAPELMRSCDVVLVQRRHDDETRRQLRTARRHGVAVVWDNDDDLRNLPARGTKNFRGKLDGQRLFSETVRAADLADVVITSTKPLATIYEAAGIENVEVIENYLPPDSQRKTRKHDGLVIGWVAGDEHQADALDLDIAGSLAALQVEQPDVHVVTLGVRLELSERYRHHPFVPFYDLPEELAGWDIGLAAIADTAFNASRSNIKVKEYAASGVPWLASARGPYAGLGAREGGRLVADDGWLDALSALARDRRARKRLAKAGQKWAKGETVEVVADRYERLLNEAVRRAAERVMGAAASA